MASIRKIKGRKKETYQLDYRDPLTGVRERKMLYCDHKTAVAILKETEARLSRREFGIELRSDNHQLLKEIFERYLLKSDKTKSTKTTIREDIVIRNFSNFIGNPNIRSITISKIEEYIHQRINRDLVSPATVGLEMRVLRAIFNQAIKWNYLNNNPLDGVTLPHSNTIKVRFLRLDEINKLLNVIPQGLFKDLVLAYLNTGARRNELLPPAFTWANVNFQLRRFHLDGKGSKKRYVPMNDSLYKILNRLREENGNVPFDFKPDFVSHKIIDYYKEAGIKGANLHSLRRTFGSLLIQSGKADLYTVSKLLGHSSIRTTEKYYVDLLDENYHESVNLLDEILSSNSLKENA